jgi:hypothetical protein
MSSAVPQTAEQLLHPRRGAGPAAELKEVSNRSFWWRRTMRGRKMHRMKLSWAERRKLARLGIDVVDAVSIRETIAKLSMLSPRAIYEVERLVRLVPPQQGWLWFHPATNSDVEIDPIHAPVLMFSRDGCVREAALKGINQLPDTPFFLAALVRRLNDWVEPFGVPQRAVLNESYLDFRLARSLGRHHFCSNECTFGADGVRRRRLYSTCSPARNACTD